MCGQAEQHLQPQGWELMRQEIIGELNPTEQPEGTCCCWKSQQLIQARLLEPHGGLLLSFQACSCPGEAAALEGGSSPPHLG